MERMLAYKEFVERTVIIKTLCKGLETAALRDRFTVRKEIIRRTNEVRESFNDDNGNYRKWLDGATCSFVHPYTHLGAFLVLFALSGVCFFSSCVFNRSKYSMSLGGGLSMFALVSTMLGLFGSKIIPSVIRLDALNYFNYVSIISLFDTVSIIGGTNDYVWKLCVLAAVGIIGYGIGEFIFRKKDLPL